MEAESNSLLCACMPPLSSPDNSQKDPSQNWTTTRYPAAQPPVAILFKPSILFATHKDFLCKCMGPGCELRIRENTYPSLLRICWMIELHNEMCVKSYLEPFQHHKIHIWYEFRICFLKTYIDWYEFRNLKSAESMLSCVISGSCSCFRKYIAWCFSFLYVEKVFCLVWFQGATPRK